MLTAFKAAVIALWNQVRVTASYQRWRTFQKPTFVISSNTGAVTVCFQRLSAILNARGIVCTALMLATGVCVWSFQCKSQPTGTYPVTLLEKEPTLNEAASACERTGRKFIAKTGQWEQCCLHNGASKISFCWKIKLSYRLCGEGQTRCESRLTSRSRRVGESDCFKHILSIRLWTLACNSLFFLSNPPTLYSWSAVYQKVPFCWNVNIQTQATNRQNMTMECVSCKCLYWKRE